MESIDSVTDAIPTSMSDLIGDPLDTNEYLGQNTLYSLFTASGCNPLRSGKTGQLSGISDLLIGDRVTRSIAGFADWITT